MSAHPWRTPSNRRPSAHYRITPEQREFVASLSHRFWEEDPYPFLPEDSRLDNEEYINIGGQAVMLANIPLIP
jgi:hypothetical protein